MRVSVPFGSSLVTCLLAGLTALVGSGLLALHAPAEGSPGGRSLLARAEPQGVDLAMVGNELRVVMPQSAWQDPSEEQISDRDFMALLPIEFGDGTIEIEVKSSLAPNAPSFARGFAGIAFRVAEGRFEKIYLRPTNGIAEDMVRRNHSVQYAAFPDFRFDRLRRESPERYETAADIAPDRWIHMQIEIIADRARLFLDRRPNPTLIVNDLKLGAGRRGRIGLWVETGTVARFRNLKIVHARLPSASHARSSTDGSEAAQ